MPTKDDPNILKVLAGLRDGKTSNVAELLFGFKQFPKSGSEADRTVLQLERELMLRDLVIVVEQGGSNATINGYYYFKISPAGSDFLRKNEPGLDPNRVVNALSTNNADPYLSSKGMYNQGLLGYVGKNESEGLFGLQSYEILFPQGMDFFYTLDPKSEKFENRGAAGKGIIGYARREPAPGYHQLFRFFSDKYQTHLFVANPYFEGLKNDYNRDESRDNPIYLKDSGNNGELPLFIYSNSPASRYFVTLYDSADSDSDSSSGKDFPRRYIEDLERVLNKRSISLSRVNINQFESSLTVQVTESNFNFYVNQQLNGKYFTVRRNPSDDEAPYIEHDITEWAMVMERFNRWIESLLRSLPDIVVKRVELSDGVGITDSFEAKVIRRLFSNAEISMGDSFAIESALGVENLAREIMKVLKNLKPHPGNMTGIFGRWGRGKTRLMNEIWKLLLLSNTDPKRKAEYVRIDYQAWRYQDTPASWAYLYEQFSHGYLGDKRKGLPSFVKFHWRLLWLNIERQGSWNIWVALGLVFSSALAGVVKLISLDTYLDWFLSLVGVTLFSVISVVVVKNANVGYLTKALSLIKKYGVKTTFNEALGIQAEIQKELIHLVKVWTGKGKKKLVLFVDDLDRCSEQKTMEIIDALRIMVDDAELKDRLLVIAAIDERILRQAVTNKYEGSIREDEKDDVSREYIDKLFIFCVKLGPLTGSESNDFFDKLTKNEIEPDKIKSNDSPPAVSAQSQPGMAAIKEPEAGANAVPNEQTFKIEFEKIEKLSQTEVNMFKGKLQYIKNSTPRKIRILYYRYMFVRNLLSERHSTSNENGYWFNGRNLETLIHLLITLSQRPIDEIATWKDKARGVGDKQIALTELEIPDTEVSGTELCDLLKIFELTIAY